LVSGYKKETEKRVEGFLVFIDRVCMAVYKKKKLYIIKIIKTEYRSFL